jgi:hypothetical protein
MSYHSTSSVGPILGAEALQHEWEISNTGRSKLDFAEIDKCKPGSSETLIGWKSGKNVALHQKAPQSYW